MSKHRIEAIHPVCVVEITFSYVQGALPVFHPDNADPGWPDEIDYISNDMGSGFDTWCIAWLADHEEEALELAREEGP